MTGTTVSESSASVALICIVTQNIPASVNVLWTSGGTAIIRSAAAPRNYVHVFISSSADLWPRHPAPPLWRKALSSIEHRLAELR